MIIFSSCDQFEIDSMVIEKVNTVELYKEKQLQEKGNSVRNFIIYIFSGVVGVLILIVVVKVLVMRKKKKITVVDENIIYGRNNPEDYYEDGQTTQIEDKNTYYG